MAGLWRLILDLPAQGAWNMAVDEAILEQAGRGESPPTLRLYDWKPACLSLGYAQPFADVDVDRLKERDWELVRRPTGGRAILHTDELTYSVSAALSDELVAGSLLESYNRLAGALLRAVELLGLTAHMKPGSDADRHSLNPVCFEVPSAYEITVAGKKLIGSAQARRRDGVLQHGSLPLSGDLARITDALAYPDDQTRREAARRLGARATSVASALKRVVSWDEAAAAFVRGFEEVLGLRFERAPLSETESHRAHALVQEKYGNPEWIQRT
jgi:lipoate-protein ligase A